MPAHWVVRTRVLFFWFVVQSVVVWLFLWGVAICNAVFQVTTYCYPLKIFAIKPEGLSNWSFLSVKFDVKMLRQWRLIAQSKYSAAKIDAFIFTLTLWGVVAVLRVAHWWMIHPTGMFPGICFLRCKYYLMKGNSHSNSLWWNALWLIVLITLSPLLQVSQSKQHT